MKDLMDSARWIMQTVDLVLSHTQESSSMAFVTEKADVSFMVPGRSTEVILYLMSPLH